jgi:hypothetical protein
MFLKYREKGEEIQDRLTKAPFKAGVEVSIQTRKVQTIAGTADQGAFCYLRIFW